MLFSFFIFLILKAVQIQSTPVAYDPIDNGLVLNAPVSYKQSDSKWTVRRKRRSLGKVKGSGRQWGLSFSKVDGPSSK